MLRGEDKTLRKTVQYFGPPGVSDEVLREMGIVINELASLNDFSSIGMREFNTYEQRAWKSMLRNSPRCN